MPPTGLLSCLSGANRENAGAFHGRLVPSLAGEKKMYDIINQNIDRILGSVDES